MCRVQSAGADKRVEEIGRKHDAFGCLILDTPVTATLRVNFMCDRDKPETVKAAWR